MNCQLKLNPSYTRGNFVRCRLTRLIAFIRNQIPSRRRKYHSPWQESKSSHSEYVKLSLCLSTSLRKLKGNKGRAPSNLNLRAPRERVVSVRDNQHPVTRMLSCLVHQRPELVKMRLFASLCLAASKTSINPERILMKLSIWGFYDNLSTYKNSGLNRTETRSSGKN
jgi:hypothetical protein